MYNPFHNVEGEEYGSYEVFRHPQDYDLNGEDNFPGGKWESGWYWWACFPGCLPDGDASGPFTSEREARKDADPR